MARNAIIAALVMVFGIGRASSRPQDSVACASGVRNVVDRDARTAICVGSVVAAGFQMRAVYARSPGWGDLRPFHIQPGEHPFFRTDKAGHAFGGYAVHSVLTNMFIWAGWNRKEAGVFAFGGVLVLRGYGEYLEGRLPYTGYDPGDNVADALGAGLGMAQGFFPVLNRIALKWSFIPRPEAYNGTSPWLQDEPRQKYWITADVYRGWCIAVGVSSTDWEGRSGRPVITVSADYNIRRFDPSSPWLRVLNLVKLPFPGIQFSPSGVRFLLVCWSS
jgi:hypothetical protein